MRGLLTKVFHETKLAVALFAVSLCAVMALLTALLPEVMGNFEELMEKISFLKPIITALIGVDPGDEMSSQTMQSFLWVHPTVLAIIWAHALMFCSRVPAAEVDRGTIDFLLGLPVSRWQLYLSETVGWLVTGGVVIATGVVGHIVSAAIVKVDMQPSHYASMCVVINLFAVYLAVGAAALLVSACSDRRGRAIGLVFGVLLFSFLLNFAAQFWEPAKSVSFLSILEYYRPAEIIKEGIFPIRNVSILVGIAATLWVAGGVIFQRRSICTV